jgi:hypothetical protein
MKDQYFGDRRDFFTWDFLEDILDRCVELKSFTNITMLTLPDTTGEGGLKDYACEQRREKLHKFLQSCVMEGKRSISEMRRYFRDKRYEHFPYRDCVASPYAYESRDEYFNGVPTTMLHKALVFLDPDIGLNVGSPSYMRRSGIDKYLFDTSLSVLSQRVTDDSAIVVYQHLQRDRTRIWDDIEERCGRFCVHVRAQGVSFLKDNDIMFMATSRDARIRLNVSNTIVAHAHLHGLECGELVV